MHAVKTGDLKILVEGLNGYNYSFGRTIPIIARAYITDKIEGRTADEATFIGNYIEYIGQQQLRIAGVPIEQNTGASEPMAGCTMVAFFDETRTEDPAAVTLTHTASGTVTLGYGRTMAAAIGNANTRMRDALKN